jgi:hypothetical protein
MSPKQTTTLKSLWLSLLTQSAGRWFWPLLVVLLICPFIIVYLVFYSAWQDTVSGGASLQTSALQQDIDDLRKQFELRQAHASELIKFSLQDKIRLSLALPTTPEIPELLVQLEAILTEGGVVNPNISVDSTTTALLNDKAANKTAKDKSRTTVSAELPTLNTNTFALNFKVSSYEHAKSVVDLIQRNLRLLDLITVAYQPATQTLNLTGRTYSLP